jgi:hypothetical protein
MARRAAGSSSPDPRWSANALKERVAQHGSRQSTARGLARAACPASAGLRSYRRILAYVRPYWLQLLLAGVSLVVVSLLNLAMPWAVTQLVDLVVVGQDLEQLNRIALALAAIFAIRTVFSFFETYLIAWVGERVVANLRRQIYDHLLSLSLGFFSGHRVGDILSRLTNDVQVIQSAVTSNLVILLQQVVTAVGVIVIVTRMDWRLAALMAVAIPGMVLITRLMGRQIRLVSRIVQEPHRGGWPRKRSRHPPSSPRPHSRKRLLGEQVDTFFQTAMRRVECMRCPALIRFPRTAAWPWYVGGRARGAERALDARATDRLSFLRGHAHRAVEQLFGPVWPDPGSAGRDRTDL